MAEVIATHLKDLPGKPNLLWNDNYNKVVRIPHVSVGQYGVLRFELPKLICLVNNIAAEMGLFAEEMSSTPSVTAENIFMDCIKIHETTRPETINLFKRLREGYFNECETHFPISQALLKRLGNKQYLRELGYIKKFYQNWGIPEENRIRPHFTLFYNYVGSISDCKNALNDVVFPDSLQTIAFTQLGILQIDTWGNPLEILHTIQLVQK